MEVVSNRNFRWQLLAIQECIFSQPPSLERAVLLFNVFKNTCLFYTMNYMAALATADSLNLLHLKEFLCYISIPVFNVAYNRQV